jgi:hypothetical protein
MMLRCEADNEVMLTSKAKRSIRQDDKSVKIAKKADPPFSIRKHRKGPVATSTVKLMSYITVKAIESDISQPQRAWPKFALKELMDNAWDFLNDYYPNNPKEGRKIAVTVKLCRKPLGKKDIVRITVRNSNDDSIPVFEDLGSVFNYDQWYSTKRYQHRETCGSQGDFLKRALGMGYASWTEGVNDDNSFTDTQWPEPVVVRCNGQEQRVFIVVNKGSSELVRVEFEQGPLNNYSYTEVEVILPANGWNECDARMLEQYFKIYKIGKSRTEFSFNAVIPPTLPSSLAEGVEQEEEIRYAKV